MWDKRARDDDGNLYGTPAGLGLTEYRLSAGFLHAPMAFWGARQISDIVRLSNSRELEPWDYRAGIAVQSVAALLRSRASRATLLAL
jgi:hypothetical protein